MKLPTFSPIEKRIRVRLQSKIRLLRFRARRPDWTKQYRCGRSHIRNAQRNQQVKNLAGWHIRRLCRTRGIANPTEADMEACRQRVMATRRKLALLRALPIINVLNLCSLPISK